MCRSWLLEAHENVNGTHQLHSLQGRSRCMDEESYEKWGLKSPYWELLWLYVDDVLCISTDPKSVLEKEIGKYWTLKSGSLGPPTIYQGNKVSKVTLENKVTTLSFSSSQYIQNAIKNVEIYSQKSNWELSLYAPSLFITGYWPETDTSPILCWTKASYYQSMMGTLRWIVELGRIDIICEASMMASMMTMPRKGHLDQLYHIFITWKGNIIQKLYVIKPFLWLIRINF